VLRRLPLLILVLPLAATGLLGCDSPPDAHLTVSPNPVAPGQTVTADSTASTNVSTTIAEYEWDLDGNGGFERTYRTGQPIEHTTFTSPGRYDVTVWITNRVDFLGSAIYVGSDSATQTVTVTDPQVPSPSFTVSPNPACSTGPVRFDASGSRDPDGSIVRYEWDLDGDGSLETNTGSRPTATKTDYGKAPAQRTTTLRVTDNDGRTATTDRALVVDDAICRPAAAASVSAAAVEHKARFALTLNGRAANRGIRLISGNHLTSSKFRAGGSVRLRGLPTPLQRVRRARWVAGLSSDFNVRTQRLRVQGEALLRLGRNGNLCTSLAITRAKGRKPSGRMKVLGGSGPARLIDGKATYTGDAGPKGPLNVRGRIEMERRAKGKGLTRACKALLPKRRG
jgi:YD repeat-containing protein